MGASERRGGTLRAIVERAVAPVRGVPAGHPAPPAGGPAGWENLALGGTLLADRGSWIANGSSLSQSGGKAFTISNTGTLQMWVRDSISFSGNAAVNTTYDALRMRINGLPTCTRASLSGNAEFTGTIYAPAADLRFNGGGADRADFMGAAIVGSAQLNGHFEFHYDENLGRAGPSSAFVIASWVEL